MGFVSKEFSKPRVGVAKDKVMTGETPANPATPAKVSSNAELSMHKSGEQPSVGFAMAV
jgi:hypothetical protein